MAFIERAGTDVNADLTRRNLLKAGGLGALGLSLPGAATASLDGAHADRAVILLLLVGGPSQLETFDPKPNASSDVRGPFGSIETAVPGIRVNEFLPRLAARMKRVALVRSLHHDAAPIHETGLQLIQTGELCRPGCETPHFGSVVARSLGPRKGCPPFVMLPGRIGTTGVAVSHGDTPGALGPEYAPATLADLRAHRDEFIRKVVAREFESKDGEDAYGKSGFGRSCRLACRLVEAGVRVVTVNAFDTVFHRVTWDGHGAAPFSTLDDYRRTLLPALDAAVSALLDDLQRSGRLDSTLVVATGEFGRAPRLNAAGGRDHWPAVWTALMAGGGVRGGQVVGASDGHAAAPADRPVTPPELIATIGRSLGLDPAGPLAATDARPIGELFA